MEKMIKRICQLKGENYLLKILEEILDDAETDRAESLNEEKWLQSKGL